MPFTLTGKVFTITGKQVFTLTGNFITLTGCFTLTGYFTLTGCTILLTSKVKCIC